VYPGDNIGKFFSSRKIIGDRDSIIVLIAAIYSNKLSAFFML